MRHVLLLITILGVFPASAPAENYSGSFLRKGQTINLIGPEESLVQAFPLGQKCAEDWRFERSEKGGAVIVVDSPRFADGKYTGIFSPHRIFGDFEAEFEMEAATQKNLRFVFGMNRAGRGISGVRLGPDEFGRVNFVTGPRKATLFEPTPAELSSVREARAKDWNRVRIRYAGETLTVTLNESATVTHTVPAGKQGAVGVLAVGKVRMKSRISVTSLDEPKDIPQMPIASAGRFDSHAGMRWVDFGILQEMARVGATSASVTRTVNVSKDRWVHDFTRTYGWLDAAKEKPAPIDAMICTATAARFPFACAWTDYLRGNGLNRNAPLFQVCNAPPDVERFGPVADQRIGQMTVHQMLLERTGWKGDPSRQARSLAVRNGWQLNSPQEWMQILWTQPLQANPGSNAAAKHTAFHAWCQITGVEAMAGKPVIEVMKEYSLKPLGVDAVELIPRDLKWLLPRSDYEHDPRLVHNARGPSVSSASSFTLATLMATHFGDGRIRNTKGAGIVCSYGLLPQSTCTLVWVGNVNWAIVLNRGAPSPSAVHDRFFGHYKKGFGKKAVTGCFLYRQMNQQITAAFAARSRR